MAFLSPIPLQKQTNQTNLKRDFNEVWQQNLDNNKKKEESISCYLSTSITMNQ